MKCKLTRQNAEPFLFRASWKWKAGSIKLHIILKDDTGELHTHPWDFTSLILFGGYVETTFEERQEIIDLQKEFYLGFDPYYNDKTYGWLSINRKIANKYHRVSLRRLWGIKIPAITIGIYGEKKQLCSLCKDLGYCKSNADKKR